jgi:DNA-binding IclR family transcriptional regulator
MAQDSNKAAIDYDNEGAPPVQAILYAADAISYIAGSNQGVGVRELARELRLTRGTSLRVLQGLFVSGLLRRDDNSLYHLGAKLVSIAAEHRRCISLIETSRRHMVGLSKVLRETVFLGVLDTTKVVIVDRVDGPLALRMTPELGVRESAFATALGRIMLSALPQHEREAILDRYTIESVTGIPAPTRLQLVDLINEAGQRGWALDDGDQVEGVRCVAAAVMDHNRQVIAAVSASAHAFRMPDDSLDEVARHVAATAASISRDLGLVPVSVGAAGSRV